MVPIASASQASFTRTGAARDLAWWSMLCCTCNSAHTLNQAHTDTKLGTAYLLMVWLGAVQDDLNETTPAVSALCTLLLGDKLAELEQHVPQVIQVRSIPETLAYRCSCHAQHCQHALLVPHCCIRCCCVFVNLHMAGWGAGGKAGTGNYALVFCC